MTRIITARWQTEAGDGLEHLVLHEAADRVVAESVVIGGAGPRPFAAHYRIACEPPWRVREVEVRLAGTGHRLVLRSDGAGRWTDASGSALPDLTEAVDVDLEVSPFTNTLPIRRLGLEAGASAEITTAWIRFPDLAVLPDAQRYTCLEPDRRYRYESLDSDFTRDLEVDDHGLVTRYPGLFRRTL